MKHWTKAGLLAGIVGCAATGTLQATPPTTVTNSFSVNQSIPDGSASGLSDTHVLDFHSQGLFSITDLTVTLNISGGFNGDYYGYLVHGNSFVVLLNRSGKTASNSFGYADSGFNITLSDGAATDIHNYQSITVPVGPLTGTWQPDGRNFDPELVLDTTPRSGSLSSFTNEIPNGEWTLFLADTDFGDQGTLVSWSMTITAVPEPGTWAILGLGLGGLWTSRRLLRSKC